MLETCTTWYAKWLTLTLVGKGDKVTCFPTDKIVSIDESYNVGSVIWLKHRPDPVLVVETPKQILNMFCEPPENK